MALKRLMLFNLNNECSKVDSGEGALNKHANIHTLDSLRGCEGGCIRNKHKLITG
jgi:hypothetical protein